jgi:hypothetical protein
MQRLDSGGGGKVLAEARCKLSFMQNDKRGVSIGIRGSDQPVVTALEACELSSTRKTLTNLASSRQPCLRNAWTRECHLEMKPRGGVINHRATA